MRLRYVLPPKDLFREQLQTTVAQAGEGFLDHAVAQAALVGDVAPAQTAALESDAFADEGCEGRSGGKGGAAEKSEVSDASVSSHGVEVGGEVRLAHKVDDDVHPLAPRGGEDSLRPVGLRPVVEPLGGAQRARAKFDFLVAARRYVDCGRACQSRELDPRDGHPRCACVPEHGVSTFEAADQMEGLVCGYIDLVRDGKGGRGRG